MYSLCTISFPRAGHHLFISILKDWFVFLGREAEFGYCDRYQCCNDNYPCQYGKQITKDHDFWLERVIDPKSRYVVQYRTDKIGQLEAYYRFVMRMDNPYYPTEDDYQKLLRFCKEKEPYYDAFMKKWVLCRRANVFCLDYDDLVTDPLGTLRSLFGWLDIEEDDRLDQFLKKYEPIIYRIHSLEPNLRSRLTRDLHRQ